jgi:hypothetical protein
MQKSFFVRAFHAAVDTVFAAHKQLAAAQLGDLQHAYVFGLFTRAAWWGDSLRRLDRLEDDFQAYCAGGRALLELLIDIALLAKGTETVEQMQAWEIASQVEVSRSRVVDGGGEPSLVDSDRQFVAAAGPQADAALAKYWLKPNGQRRKRPPMRWTGRRGLAEDAAAADAVGLPNVGGLPSGFLSPPQLAGLVRDHYAMLCRGTHGSALILERMFPNEQRSQISQFVLALGADFLLRITHLVLENFGALTPEWEHCLMLAKMGAPLGAEFPRKGENP